MPKCEEHDQTRQKSGEEKGMRKSSMAPKVGVRDAEPEADDVQIGKDRAECPDYPDSLWRARLVEASSNAECCDRV